MYAYKSLLKLCDLYYNVYIKIPEPVNYSLKLDKLFGINIGHSKFFRRDHVGLNEWNLIFMYTGALFQLIAIYEIKFIFEL